MITCVQLHTEVLLSEAQLNQENPTRYGLLEIVNICWFVIHFFNRSVFLGSVTLPEIAKDTVLAFRHSLNDI